MCNIINEFLSSHQQQCLLQIPTALCMTSKAKKLDIHVIFTWVSGEKTTSLKYTWWCTSATSGAVLCFKGLANTPYIVRRMHFQHYIHVLCSLVTQADWGKFDRNCMWVAGIRPMLLVWASYHTTTSHLMYSVHTGANVYTTLKLYYIMVMFLLLSMLFWYLCKDLPGLFWDLSLVAWPCLREVSLVPNQQQSCWHLICVVLGSG